MRFTIRDLLWLTVVVALGVGWWMHRRDLVQRHSATKREAALWESRATAMLRMLNDLKYLVEYRENGGTHIYPDRPERPPMP